MIYLIIIIMIFLFVVLTLCKYGPIFAATKNEKQYMLIRIKHPNVFAIK